MKITITVYGGNLIPANDAGIDIECSQHRYCTLLRERIRAEYPDAELSIGLQRNTEGAAPAPVIEADSYEEEAEAQVILERIVEGLSPDEWIVPAELLSTAQAATALGITEMRVRQLCQDGRMGRRIGDTWVITPEEIEANKIRKAGRPAVEYEVKGEFGGYKVRKSPKGFIVEFWSAVQGQQTDDKYLLPYGTGGCGHTFDRGTDLSAKVSDIATYGDALIQALRDGAPHKVLNRGRVVH